MGKVYLDEQILTDIADATRSKTGSSAALMPGQMADEIESIGQITSVPEKDVNFYDYDGTLLYSYTKQEFLELNSLPPNPTHEGLISQGWNNTLEELVVYLQDNDAVISGALYITDDNKTRIYIKLDYNLEPYTAFAVNGTATIDWGDNTTPDIVTGTSYDALIYTKHTYSKPGNYIITIDGIVNFFSGSKYIDTLTKVLCYDNTLEPNFNRYAECIYKIELGKIYNLGNGSLYGCKNLETITMTKYENYRTSKSLVSGSTFRDCSKLKAVVLPSIAASNYSFANFSGILILPLNYERENFKAIGNDVANGSTFDTLYLHGWIGGRVVTNNKYLKRLFLDNTGVTSLGQTAFSNCPSLCYIKIPSSVITIDQEVFKECYNLYEVDCSRLSQVPTLQNTNAFSGVLNLHIVVPDDLYEDWIVANNWSTFASKIIKKSDWDALNEEVTNE